MVILDKSFVKVTLDKELECIIQKWIGFCDTENFIEAVKFCFDYMKQNNIHKIISDTTEQKVVSKEGQIFSKEIVEKRAKEDSKFKIVFIMPSSVIAQMAVKSFGSMTEEEVIQQSVFFVDNINDAKKIVKIN